MRPHVAAPRCPFCLESVARGEPLAVCVWCHAFHHASCWTESGRCSSCEAREAPRARRANVGLAAPIRTWVGGILGGLLLGLPLGAPPTVPVSGPREKAPSVVLEPKPKPRHCDCIRCEIW